MVVVRLARGGVKRHPFYHIVVTDSRRRRDSSYIERLGYFNPFATKEEVPVLLNRDRFDYWISKGAKSSQRVSSIVSKLDKGKFAIKAKAEKVDSDTIETPKSTKTENETPAEAKSSDTKASTATETEKSKPASSQAELENDPKDLKEEKQDPSSEAKAESEDSDGVLSAEPPVESAETDKKADDK